ncbi:MAG: TadE/TadG family type IV pilus assembly protein [Sphingomonas sp.]|jgi:Flp pilus assembly protein TadG|uniref:TadE/TadG family type IV pilus assembly protein n=1 Tax=Sphingomonas sp. TaxID=28214 RepID=UPI0035673900
MRGNPPITKATPRGFLSALARDVRGNTLAMMAMFLIPLSGLVGSAVDISRLYVVKARLQQACDAGALAGRKFMVDPGPNLDANATTQAQNFFANNFKKDNPTAGTLGFMNSSAVIFTPTRTTDNQVAGAASASVPMTITKMFGTSAITINVGCQARFDVADTDIMFVLDTTGSMACLPGGSDSCGTGTYTYTRPSGSGGVSGYAGTTAAATNELMSGGSNVSRIEALRKAVLSFYDTFATNADPSTKVRYGFVTYTSGVNAGQAILDMSSNYLVGSGGSTDTAKYQSRHIYSDAVLSFTETANNKTQANCTAPAVRVPSTALTYNPSSGTATNTYDEWVATSSKNSTKICKTRVDTLVPKWEYKQLTFDVSSLLTGATITDPTKVQGQTTSWIGCVETKVDNPGASSFTVTNLPSELNPDLIPAKGAGGSSDTRWWPHLQDLEYARNNWNGTATDYSNGDDPSNNPNYGVDPKVSNNTTLRNGGYVTCGKPVKRLGVMTRAEVSSYLYATDFVPMGGTYHDTGMIWGTRLISPTGPWANDTAAWPNRNAPNRVIIFLTDGAMAPSTQIYGMYGVEAFDQRVAGTTGSNLTDLHNARFLAECAAAKARNIDVWTVSIAPSANTQLTSCATTSAQALATTDGGGLSTAFANIARRLALLRLTR